ncbi:hypothetical protein CRUP_031008 [Coryphaenoides rupestris]|nr:hypothetical protein CRUP_031008 [Coryphaenoides rupestris]
MRPFFGYNFGHYLSHWLSMAERPGAKLPRIFHVNWFRKSATTGAFLWPGFGDNIRVLDWMFRRLDGEAGASPSAGLAEPVDPGQLFSLDRSFWRSEAGGGAGVTSATQVNDDLPREVAKQLDLLETRIEQM